MKGVEGVDFKRVEIKNGARAGKVIEIPIRKGKPGAAAKPVEKAAPKPVEKEADGAGPGRAGVWAWHGVGAAVGGVVTALLVVALVRRLGAAGSAPEGESAEVIDFPGGRVS